MQRLEAILLKVGLDDRTGAELPSKLEALENDTDFNLGPRSYHITLGDPAEALRLEFAARSLAFCTSWAIICYTANSRRLLNFPNPSKKNSPPKVMVVNSPLTRRGVR